MTALEGLRAMANLNRVGIAKHEEAQGEPKKSLLQVLNERSGDLEKLLRTMPQIEHLLRDLRRGMRSRANSFFVEEFDTSTVPATAPSGVIFDCAKLNGGVPWDSFTIDDVGGAGTTLRAIVNGSKPLPVGAGDFFDNLEIWTLNLRVLTGGAGTGRVVMTSYVPGIGGLSR